VIEEQLSGPSFCEAAKHWLHKAQIMALANVTRQNFEVSFIAFISIQTHTHKIIINTDKME
jgi:hypothetical protein